MSAMAPATLRDQVMGALATVADADGVIVHGQGRVLAFRQPSLNGAAVLIDLDHGDVDPTPPRQKPVTRKHPVAHLPADGERLRADARTHPVQIPLPWIE